MRVWIFRTRSFGSPVTMDGTGTEPIVGAGRLLLFQQAGEHKGRIISLTATRHVKNEVYPGTCQASPLRDFEELLKEREPTGDWIGSVFHNNTVLCAAPF